MYDTIVALPHIVLDTNVFVAALRSRRGASHRLLQLVGRGKFEVNVSVPIVLEYEAAAKKLVGEVPLTVRDIDDIIDYVCKVARQHRVYYLWRPFLKDPDDDMVLELAVTSGSQVIVSYNKADFEGAEKVGVRVLTAKEFLEEIGELS
jgi:putative PIN family toxin of toxin-antitoxin system